MGEQRRQLGFFERHLCTKDDPWTYEKSRAATHPDAVTTGEWLGGVSGGNFVAYRCPHCCQTWTEEVPCA